MEIRKRMDDAASEHQIWTSFRRRGQTRRGMRDSVTKYICPGKAEPTLEECFAAVLDGNKENPDVLDLALQELLDECDGDGAIQQEGRSMLPRFCWPEFTGALETDSLVKALGKANRWEGQFAFYGEDNFYLRWPKDNDKWPAEKRANAWYRRLSEFSLLSVDLGQRDAGAFAVIGAAAGKPTHPASRFIGEANGHSWHTNVRATGVLRLPGEDAQVFRSGQWQEELYGERGRSADAGEWTEAKQICEALGLKPAEILGDDPQWFSFSELNDRLLFAIRRAQTRLG